MPCPSFVPLEIQWRSADAHAIVDNIATLDRLTEKPVSAAIANRKFSALLRTVRKRRSYVIAAHGKPIAKIVPIEKNGGVAPSARRALLKRLQSQRVVKIGRWKRDELYEREPRG